MWTSSLPVQKARLSGNSAGLFLRLTYQGLSQVVDVGIRPDLSSLPTDRGVTSHVRITSGLPVTLAQTPSQRAPSLALSCHSPAKLLLVRLPTMPVLPKRMTLDISAAPFRRAFRYAFYDWAREMPRAKRILMYVAIALQGYPFYFALMWAWSPPWLSPYFLIPPKRPLAFVLAILVYYVGRWLQNGLLTSEFVRKTQLEADQIAARQIQQTLQPGKLEELPGYELETLYKPLREVGGDYFDVIELPAKRTLFALADVSGKGIPAALRAANIQALVRSIASVESNPLALAKQINEHLIRYSPIDRFATAVFVVLSRDSGELSYVNAGHNSPILYSSGSTTFLEATGLPLGLFSDAQYEARTAVMNQGSSLLMFSDGLPDSIQGEQPENRLCDAFAESAGRTMANLKSLIDPKFNEDDVTILLAKRIAGSSSGLSTKESRV